MHIFTINYNTMASISSKPHSKLKDDDYNKAVALMESRKVFNGYQLVDIANELGIPKSTMYRYKKRYIKELSAVHPTEKVEKMTTTIVMPTKLQEFGVTNMEMVLDELENLTQFKWDGVQLLVDCIAEFRKIIADPLASLPDKIKLFKLIVPYIAAEIPIEDNNAQGANGTMTVANIYTQAQNFYQQQNVISNETSKTPNSRNKKK
jgi:hypothetical protein